MSPENAMLQLIVGYWNTQALRTAARLGIADLIVEKRLDCRTLAAATGTDPDALARLLNFLRGIHVLEGDAVSGFGLTKLGRLLRSDIEGSMRDLAMLYGEEFYQAWGSLLQQVQTGEPAFSIVFGNDMFGYFSENRTTGRLYDRAMTAGRTFLASVPDVHDFSGRYNIVDVACGSGMLLAAILKKHRDASGILFDQAPVLESTRKMIAAQGLADRCRFEAGDFFKSVPQGGDCYLLSRILHDWEDEQCRQLLANCRDAAQPRSDLIIVERVLPRDGEAVADGALALGYDLHMMAVAGGRERSEDAYRALLSEAGFDLRASHALPLGVRALVATRC